MIDECITNPTWRKPCATFLHYATQNWFTVSRSIHAISGIRDRVCLCREAPYVSEQKYEILVGIRICVARGRPTRKPEAMRNSAFRGLARSSNYPVYSIYITYTNAYPCPTPKPPQRRSMSPPSHRRPHGNRSNYRRVSESTDWIQKLCRWRNNIRHTFARVNIELSFLVISHERRRRRRARLVKTRSAMRDP